LPSDDLAGDVGDVAVAGADVGDAFGAAALAFSFFGVLAGDVAVGVVAVVVAAGVADDDPSPSAFFLFFLFFLWFSCCSTFGCGSSAFFLLSWSTIG